MQSVEFWLARRIGSTLFKRQPKAYMRLYFAYKNLRSREEISFYRSVLRPGDFVVDVGANVGFFSSIFSSLVGSEGKVFAVEPYSENLRHLRRLQKALENLEIWPVAAGASSDLVELFNSAQASTDVHVGRRPESRDTGLLVQQKCLDEMLAGVVSIRLLKIDVQGHELEVLRGAKLALSRFHDVYVHVEISPDLLEQQGASAQDVYETLSECGFCPLNTGAASGESLTDLSLWVNAIWYRA